MSKRHRFGGGHSPGEMDFELNLAPIIDCLVVLITFTLISASFLSVTVFDAGAAPNSASQSQTPPPVSIAVQIEQSGEIEIKVSGDQNRTTRVPASSGAPDYAGLSAELKQLRAQWPTVDGVSLAAQGRVDYKAIVKAMEASRESFPAVMLGGF